MDITGDLRGSVQLFWLIARISEVTAGLKMMEVEFTEKKWTVVSDWLGAIIAS